MKPLLHKKEFEALLANYKVSDTAKNVLAKVNFVCLVGVSSSGKDTIMKKLAQSGKYHIVVSDTTRAPRINNGVTEQNGIEYWFKSEEEMLRNLQKGTLLEAEVIHDQQVSGTSIDELERAAKRNKIAINAIDPAGIEHILATKPDTTIILIIPPSFKQWLERLLHRGKMEDSEIKRRVATFPKVFQLLYKYPEQIHCVINENLDTAVVKVDAIANKQDSSYISSNSDTKKVVEDLLKEAEDFIAN